MMDSFRSFPRKRESRAFRSGPWVPAFAGTSGVREQLLLRLEPADRLLDQLMVYDMDLDATPDPFEQRDGQLAAEMLLEVGEPGDDAAALVLVAQVERIVPQR